MKYFSKALLSMFLFSVLTGGNLYCMQSKKEEKTEDVQKPNIVVLKCEHVFAIEDIQNSEITTCPICGEEIDEEVLEFLNTLK